MRKKMTLLILLSTVLLCGTGWAQQCSDQPVEVARLGPWIGGSVPVADSGCAAPLVFQWSMEDFDPITDGTPAGCTDNATTAVTVSGGDIELDTDVSPVDGTYSLYLRWDADYASIPITMGNNGEEGTIDVYIYYGVSTLSWDQMLLLSYDADNVVSIYTDGTGHFCLKYRGTATDVNLSSAVTIVEDTWHHVLVKWKRGAATTLSIKVDAETPVTSSSALAAMAGVPSLLKFQNITGGSAQRQYDIIKVYNTWQ